MNFYDPAKRSFRTFARLYSSTPKTACATIATSLVTDIAAMTSPLHFFKASFALRLCAIITLTLILALFAGANFSRWSAGKEAKARSLLLVRNLFVDEKPSSLMLYAHPALFESTNELDWPSHLYYLRGRLGSLTSIDALRSTVATSPFLTATQRSQQRAIQCKLRLKAALPTFRSPTFAAAMNGLLHNSQSSQTRYQASLWGAFLADRHTNHLN